MDILEPLALPVATLLMVSSAIVVHNYQIPAEAAGIPGLSNVLGNYMSTLKDSIQAHLNEPGKIVETLATLLETMFMIDTRQTREEQMNGSAPKVFLHPPRQSKLEKLADPPVRTAIVAWVIFILSAQYIYESREADRYQKRFLYAGLIIGINASVVAWIISAENLYAFKSFIPASVAASLVLSSSAHRFIIPKEVEKEKKEQ